MSLMEFMTAEEIGEAVGLSSIWIRQLARENRIRGSRLGNIWVFRLSEVQEDLRESGLSGLTIPIEPGGSIR